MDPVAGALVVLAPVVLALGIGLLVRWRTGRVRSERRALGAVVAEHGALGERATLLQFSTEFCTSCRATRSALERVAISRPGVTHLEVDLTHRPELARRLGILQTPTTFLLDANGRGRARVGGAPRIADLTAELDSLLGGTRVRTP